MWPKAISSLIELAPHVSRLIPLADRFFQSKSSEADAAQTAMEQMAAGMRGDLGQVTASHAGLYRQLNDQSAKLTSLAEGQREAALTSALLSAEIAILKQQVRVLLGISATTLVVSIGVIVVVVVLRK